MRQRMKYALHSLTHFSLHCCGGQGLGVSLRCRIYNASDDERRAKCRETRRVSHPSPGESRTTADGWNECTKLEIVQLQGEGRNPQNVGSAQLGGTRHVEVTLFVGSAVCSARGKIRAQSKSRKTLCSHWPRADKWTNLVSTCE